MEDIIFKVLEKESNKLKCFFADRCSNFAANIK